MVGVYPNGDIRSLFEFMIMDKKFFVFADGILRVYNAPLCETLDNYNCSAYYEPSPYIAQCYYAGGF